MGPLLRAHRVLLPRRCCCQPRLPPLVEPHQPLSDHPPRLPEPRRDVDASHVPVVGLAGRSTPNVAQRVQAHRQIAPVPERVLDRSPIGMVEQHDRSSPREADSVLFAVAGQQQDRRRQLALPNLIESRSRSAARQVPARHRRRLDLGHHRGRLTRQQLFQPPEPCPQLVKHAIKLTMGLVQVLSEVTVRPAATEKPCASKLAWRATRAGT
jgi:hypothetical protein